MEQEQERGLEQEQELGQEWELGQERERERERELEQELEQEREQELLNIQIKGTENENNSSIRRNLRGYQGSAGH